MTRAFGPGDALRVFIVRCDAPFPTDGEYVRRFWMSQIGPTSTALLQLMAAGGDRVWRAHDLAVRVGVGGKVQNHANNPLRRSLDRLEQFRLIERNHEPPADRIYVRSHLQRLEAHQLARVTDEMRAEHAAFVASLAEASA